MALDFSGASTNRVNCGQDSSMDNLDPYTVILWARRTGTISYAHGLYRKGPSTTESGYIELSDTSGNLRIHRGRATTNCTYTTNDTPFGTLNEWKFIAVVFDTGAGANEIFNCYHGNLTTLATESTYGSTTDGSGAIDSDISNDLYIGNKVSLDKEWKGDIALFSYISGALTLAQIRSLQFRPRKVSGTRLLLHLGFAGNASQTQPDWSGNGNNGTVTGATVAPHVPLPVFPFRIWMPYAVAAVGRTTKNTDPYGLGIAPGVSRTFKVSGL